MKAQRGTLVDELRNLENERSIMRMLEDFPTLANLNPVNDHQANALSLPPAENNNDFNHINEEEEVDQNELGYKTSVNESMIEEGVYNSNGKNGGTGESGYSYNNSRNVNHPNYNTIVDDIQRDKQLIQNKIQRMNRNTIVADNIMKAKGEQHLLPSLNPYINNIDSGDTIKTSSNQTISISQQPRRQIINRRNELLPNEPNRRASQQILQSENKSQGSIVSLTSGLSRNDDRVRAKSYRNGAPFAAKKLLPRYPTEIRARVNSLPQQAQNEPCVSDSSIERLLSFNEQLKEQFGSIIQAIEGKIQRAKQKKVENLASDPHFMVIKGLDDKLKGMCAQRNSIKKDIDQINTLLDERYNINNIISLENEYRQKTTTLMELQRQYEFTKHQNAQQEEVLQGLEQSTEQKSKGKSHHTNEAEIKSAQSELKALRKQQNEILKSNKERHTMIQVREQKTKLLMTTIQQFKEGKNSNQRTQREEQLDFMEHKIVMNNKELFELQAKKKHIESQYGKELSDLQYKIKQSQLDVQVLELKLKDKDHMLRGNIIRKKELQNIIEEHKKLKKAERKKSQQNQALQLLQVIRKQQLQQQQTEHIRKSRERLIQELPKSQPEERIPIQEEAPVVQYQEEVESTFFGLTQIDDIPKMAQAVNRQQANKPLAIMSSTDQKIPQPIQDYQPYQHKNFEQDQQDEQMKPSLIISQMPIFQQQETPVIEESRSQLSLNYPNVNSSVIFQGKASPVRRYDKKLDSFNIDNDENNMENALREQIQ